MRECKPSSPEDFHYVPDGPRHPMRKIRPMEKTDSLDTLMDILSFLTLPEANQAFARELAARIRDRCGTRAAAEVWRHLGHELARELLRNPEVK